MAQVITGIDAINQLLRDLPAAFSERALLAALKLSAEPIRDEAKRLVAKDSGKLEDSIIITTAKREGDEDAAVLVTFKTSGGATGWKAHFIEFGTSKMAAQPFLRPAFDNKINEAKNLIATNLETILRRRVPAALRSGNL